MSSSSQTSSSPESPQPAGGLGDASLNESDSLHSTVTVPPPKAGFWRQYRAYIGPAILVSVGYMDPGNWATDLAAGAQFKYDLLWIVALASLMAVVLQVLSARLGIATGKDLAQCCRDYFPKWTRLPNWILMELAIGATDLAEVIGSAVALNLLFHIPIGWAILITAFDVLLLLALQGLGMRMLEAVVTVFVGTIAVCYGIELFALPQVQPSSAELLHAFLHPGLAQAGMLVAAIGIIGATVMPHNLFLHSALVQTRKFGRDEASIGNAIRFNTLDSAVALSAAFLINAAILVLAGMVFFGRSSITLPNGNTLALTPESDWIRIAHLTLAPLLGSTLASTLFAVALLASGQSSTITGTLAGQVVMEGFMSWRVRPWIRRMISRLTAIVPAVLIVTVRGADSLTDLLVLSQVSLCLLLPIATFPLLFFTSSSRIMGRWRNGWGLLLLGWGCGLLITALDLYSLPASLRDAGRIILGH